jgi:hypothetical protein
LKFLHFFLFLRVIFILLDPDLHQADQTQCGSGAETLDFFNENLTLVIFLKRNNSLIGVGKPSHGTVFRVTRGTRLVSCVEITAFSVPLSAGLG